MSDDYNSYSEPMLEMFIFETTESMEQLEEILLVIEETNAIKEEDINEIFRIMHTIKGSSSMMMFSNISKLTHSLEDLFYYIRENKIYNLNLTSLSDLVFSTIDFIRLEISNLEKGKEPKSKESKLTESINEFLKEVKKDKIEINLEDKIEKKEKNQEKSTFEALEDIKGNKYKAVVKFEKDCKMENMRAFTIVRDLEEYSEDISHYPEDLFDDDNASGEIIKRGFALFITSTETMEELHSILKKGLFVDEVNIEKVDDFQVKEKLTPDKKNNTKVVNDKIIKTKDNLNIKKKQNIISVNVEKMDALMDLVGEIVITESMVTKNPDILNLDLENFNKSARQLRKLNNELQDVVMSMRMIPIGPNFHKMHRIVRDMNKKLNKNVKLEISGEETEVDKTIIDALGEPLMHLVRNALDHGIEDSEIRIKNGKDKDGFIKLDAVNTGGEVIIKIKDDGKGLDREEILEKAKKNNLISKSFENMKDKEVFSLILLPGFSTKGAVTEYSGRGVGMDVVKKSIDKVRGTIQIDSEKEKGTTIIIKIPLTLAIIDGMKISVGDSIFTIPTTTIKESFKAKKEALIKDTVNNEMIMIREKIYPMIRLHKIFDIDTNITNFNDGILVMVESDDKNYCLFADEILGEQQVVVKSVPGYLRQYKVENRGISGCAILGNADISLILDISGISNKYI